MMRRRIILFLAIMLISVEAIAQNASTQMATNKDYVIGPGDILAITVWDHPDLERTVEVSQEGDFTFPFVGRIKADRRSVFDLEKFMAKQLGNGYLVAPQVNISISEYRNQKVFVFGEVNQPGSYVLRRRIHLMEVISEAGGFSENRGASGIIVRPRTSAEAAAPISPENAGKNQVIQLDLDDLINGRTNAGDFMVAPGDSIYIHPAQNVFVVGEVVEPGRQKWEKGLTVREAISLAGGGTKSSALNRTKIIRKVEGREKEISPKQEDELLPNDVVRVPQSWF